MVPVEAAQDERLRHAPLRVEAYSAVHQQHVGGQGPLDRRGVAQPSDLIERYVAARRRGLLRVDLSDELLDTRVAFVRSRTAHPFTEPGGRRL